MMSHRRRMLMNQQESAKYPMNNYDFTWTYNGNNYGRFEVSNGNHLKATSLKFFSEQSYAWRFPNSKQNTSGYYGSLKPQPTPIEMLAAGDEVRVKVNVIKPIISNSSCSILGMSFSLRKTGVNEQTTILQSSTGFGIESTYFQALDKDDYVEFEVEIYVNGERWT